MEQNGRITSSLCSPVNELRTVQVVVNERLQVWTGAQATITKQHLMAVDDDTQPSQIIYVVSSPPTNGELKLKDYMASSITNFTQQQIDDGHVLFVHTGQ